MKSSQNKLQQLKQNKLNNLNMKEKKERNIKLKLKQQNLLQVNDEAEVFITRMKENNYSRINYLYII